MNTNYQPNWFKVELPKNVEQNTIEGIRNEFRKSVANPISLNYNTELAKLYQDINNPNILYFSPTNKVYVFALIEKYSGIKCNQPNIFSVREINSESICSGFFLFGKK